MPETNDGMTTGTTEDGYLPQYYPLLTEAEKPTNPNPGDKCSIAENGKEYTCFVTNVWSLTNSPVYEDYYNHLGTVDNVMSIVLAGDGTGLTDAANHEIDLSSGLSGSATYQLNLTTFPNSGSFEFNTVVKNISLGAGIDLRTYTIGLYGVDCIARFQQTSDISGDGSWQCYTYDTTTAQLTDISAISSGDILSIKNYGNIIMFLVNGIIVATHSNMSYGSNSGVFLIKTITSGATTERQISVDYIGLKVFR